MNSYTLSYQSACRLNIKFPSCMGEIRWNGEVIESIAPADYKIRNSTFSVSLKDKNVLSLKGTGISDGFGLTVDNFNLHKVGSTQNLLTNGDFETPDLKKGWKILTNPSGWVGKDVEIGFGSIYNSAWTSQVCELDSDKNYEVTQTVSLDLSQLYSYSLISTTVHKKKPPTPVSVSIPTTKDKINETNGETSETIEYSSSNEVLQTLMTQTNTYLISFNKSVPSTKAAEYKYVLSLFETAPITLNILKNCKYTELAFVFKASNSYSFIYFIRDNKSKELSYFGMLNSTSATDPSFVKSS